jgi:hypothetical protein
MSSLVSTVEQWQSNNRGRIVQCRWGCSMTADACLAYQLRTDRYVVHFQGTASPKRTVNADYVRCFLPEPCPHALSDEEVGRIQEGAASDKAPLIPKYRQGKERGLMRDRLVNPDRMVEEPDWRRSLLLSGQGDQLAAEGLY